MGVSALRATRAPIRMTTLAQLMCLPGTLMQFTWSALTPRADKLRVNDVDYSGTSGPDGVVPQGTIGWSSEPWMPVRNRYLVFTVGGGFKIPWLRGRLDQPPRLENLPARDAGGIM